MIDESKRALPAGVVDPAPQPWSIPVCVRYGDRKRSERACGVGAIETTFCPTWIVPNADANGYYRSELPAKLVRADRMTVPEKMMAFSDLRAMVERGEGTLDVVLAAIPAMLADKDPRIGRWALVASDLRFDALDDRLYEASRAWIAKTVGPTARALGWKRARGDSDDRHKLRILALWWTARRDPALRAQAETLADRWLADRTGLDDDLVDAALSAAARGNDPARFDRVLAAAKAPRDRNEQQRLLAALAAFNDPKLEQRALALTLAHEFDLRDSIEIVKSALRGHETRDVAFAFVQQHLDELLAHMRSDEAAGLLARIAEVACEPDRRKIVADLVTPRAAKFDGAQNAVAQALERADRCSGEVAHGRAALERVLK